MSESKKKDIQIIERSISELRISLNGLDQSLSKIGSQIIYFITGQLGVLAYVFNDNKLFSLHERYGLIFLFIGLFSTLISLSILFYLVFGVRWELTTDLNKLTNLDFKNYYDFIEYQRKEHLYAYKHNMKTVQKRFSLLRSSFIFMFIGGIVLLIIKSFS
jgi:hypothetical protein